MIISLSNRFRFMIQLMLSFSGSSINPQQSLLIRILIDFENQNILHMSLLTKQTGSKTGREELIKNFAQSCYE